jgi:hypothetical protein
MGAAAHRLCAGEGVKAHVRLQLVPRILWLAPAQSSTVPKDTAVAAVAPSLS